MMNKFPKKLGVVFGEGVEIGKKRRNLADSKNLKKAQSWDYKDGLAEPGQRQDLKLSKWRLAPVYLLFSTLIIIMLARAFDLQVIQGEVFLGRAQGNYIRVQINHAPRGVIFDREGVVLAQSKPGFALSVEPKSIPPEKKREVLTKLAKILKMSVDALEKKLTASDEEQVVISTDISPDQSLLIEAQEEALPGVVLEISPVRYYPFKETAAHILGYTTEADTKDLARDLLPPYELGDRVGKAGVEASFEEALRGDNGYTLTNVAATGEKKGQLYQSDPKSGSNINLSIDIKLQQFVYEALQKKIKSIGAKRASAVVMNPKSGEILALVSLPSYDNNLFSQRLTQKKYDKLVSDFNKPLLNRAVGAAYPPGSTFKMVTATAGLESGAIKPDTKIEDPGFIRLGDQVFNNWLWLDSRKKEGAINVVRAIARSTDTFFYRLGQMIGEKAIEKYALEFGLGVKTGIELPSETAGLVPNEKWKLATKGEPWYPGETLNISIGQGDLLLTPLQISRVISVFANGGKLVVPTILKTNDPNVEKNNFLKKVTLKSVEEGLYQNTVGDGNVGWLFSDFKIKTAGKTGTAESEKETPHAWYTGYAPYPNAEIVVTVQIEHAGHGSEQSAPVVKEIFKWYFSNR